MIIKKLNPSKAAMLPMLIGGVLLSSVACSPSPAHADCRARLQAIANNYSKVQGALPQQVRGNLNRLHQSGELLVKSGRESLCNDVADAMHSIMQNHQDVIKKARRKMRFANAPSVTQIRGAIRVSEINGTTIYSKNAKKLGTVKDVVVNPSGRIAYVAMSTDDKLIAVPWKSFKLVKKGNMLVLGMGRKRLQSLHGFKQAKWPLKANPKLQSQGGAS